ncbi:arginine--tRNA ligase [Anaerococcus hydrogenalis]|uniref:Arginine--tRNA ligase n=1 Tax=Anaerococcus hydrogenalis TaxID=33029 RepID=A0A2N6UI95_9FIRM|nr:arginine--tRNA ligase [Anaerococcus hydrogenalis]MDK7694678.1 arginine--tRNA ligase [Anaerococcus hydrogenalis]MDK7696768.1 arginine--tRNA ligase [Anaerococcus hydrogenalis]MDK7707705.1 arginine--tRNA ligase [Anaerococcus hydrogenalis]PMC81323.1 arginine--tRNA ligase [Anaerococcus hydrogenalis]
MEDLKGLIAKKLEEKELGLDFQEIYDLIEIPPQDDMGDFSFPCFILAKKLRKNPAIIAKELKEDLEKEDSPYFSKVDSLNAYLNFYIDRKYLQGQVLREIIKEKENYGRSDMGKGKNIVLDFSSVNIAKPFHIGHIRSTVIGDAIRNIHDFLGYNTIASNYIGDYGTQFGIMIAAYKLWGDDDKLNQNPIKELLNLYVRYNEQASNDQDMMNEARDEFRRLEEGEEEAVRLWSWFKEISFKEFDRVYKLLDINFDNYHGEAYQSKYIPDVLDQLKEKNLLTESDGAQIIDLSKYDLPPAIIIKSNGSSAYITRDIATAINRKKTYNFSENLYVVATQQNLHFQQLWAILELMGYDFYKDCKHIPFGMVSLKDQTLSTRKGQVVFLEDVLNKAIDKTKEIMKDRDSALENLDETAQIVGIGAVKFQELYNNRIKDYVFDWDNLLNFEGETGPYVQYSYARAKSVLKKGQIDNFDKVEFDLLNTDEEFNLIKSLAEFKESIVRAKEKYEPSIISRKIMDIAKNFNKFYNTSKIMVDDEKLKEQRLALAYATSIVIKNGLKLLGIKTVDQM